MLDYRPDLDPRTPGLLTDVRDMIPTEKGYRAAYGETVNTAHTYSVAANETYPTKVFASRWLSTPGGIVIVGTNQKLNVYDFTNGFINVSKAGNYSLASGVYPYGEDARAAFDICAYGDVIIACNRATATQSRSALDLTIATLFADLSANAPAAATCCMASNFVFLGNVGNWSTGPAVTGTNNMLVWSALGDHTGWVNNPTVTQCSYATFTDTPGPITAVRPLRDGVVVFKANAMYLGRYVGAGTNSPIWDFVRISDNVGCLGPRSVANIDNALVFVGIDDIYLFDGTRPQPITRGILETIKPYLTDTGESALFVSHNKPNASVWFSALSGIYIWNYKFNRWGYLRTTETGTLAAVLCETNTDDFRTKTMSSVTSGYQEWTTSTNHFNLYSLYFHANEPVNRNTTRATTGRVITGAIGQADKLQTLTRVNPLYARRPATVTNATLTVGTSITPGNFSNLAAVTMDSSYRFDMLATAGTTSNFFRLQHDCAEDHELVELQTAPTLVSAGSR